MVHTSKQCISPFHWVATTTCIPDQNFSQTSCAGSVNELLRLSELQVHVAVRRNKETFVFMAPLQLDHHDLSEKAVEERLRIDNCRHRKR